jgi:hypothetical protein
MKVPTRLWGDVDAVYWRDDQGREGLRTESQEWNFTVAPPILVPRDLSNTGDWDTLLTRALQEAKLRGEDSLFAYKPPPEKPRGLDVAMSTPAKKAR